MKFIAIGELMLRLSPPNYEKIVTTHNFIVNYGGAEAALTASAGQKRMSVLRRRIESESLLRMH